MRSLVLLLTDYFPYETGEEFLESEIEYLATVADEIIIVPVRATAPSSRTRDLPTNVKSYIPQAPTKKSLSKRARLFSRALLSQDRMLSIRKLRHPRNFGSDALFTISFLDVYERISECLASIDFGKYSSAVVYSYWFSTGVGVGRQLILNELSHLPAALIARGHRYDIETSLAWRNYLPSRDYFLRIIDRVYAISDYAQKQIQSLSPAYSEKVLVERLGVSKGQVSSRTLFQPPHLVTCSTIAPVKRLPLLIEALSLIEKQGIQVRWTHIGGADHDAFKLLQSLVADKLSNTEVTLTGHKSNADVLHFLDTEPITYFVNVSSSEGVPVSIMEAQARSLPIIATAAGGTGEVVKDGHNGVLLPVDCDAKQLADALHRAIEISPRTYEKWSVEARATWNFRSNASVQYSRFGKEIISLLGQEYA